MNPTPPPSSGSQLPTNQNVSPAVVPSRTTITMDQQPPPPPPGEGKRLIRTIRPIDISRLQQSGLDRKIAEALSKQKHTILNKSSQLGSKVASTAASSKGSSSNINIPSNHIKFMKPVATQNNPATQPSSGLKTTTSVTHFKPLPTHSATQQSVTSASSPTPLVAAAPKPLIKKYIIPPKITITGPEAPTDTDKHQMKDLSPEQRMKHVKSLLHKKILQRQTYSASEDMPKLYTHLKPPSNESQKAPPSKAQRRSKQLLHIPDISSQQPTDVMIAPNDNQLTSVLLKLENKPRPTNTQQQLVLFGPDTSRCVIKDSLKPAISAVCTNEDKQFFYTPPVYVSSFNHQRTQRDQVVSGPLYNNGPFTPAYTYADKQLSQMSPVFARSFQQPNLRSQEMYNKQWPSLYIIPDNTTIYQNEEKHFPQTSSVIMRHTDPQQEYCMPKLLVKPVNATYSNTKDKQLSQTPAANLRNSEERGETTPSNKLPTKPKTPQKSPQDIARKLDFQTDQRSKDSQYERTGSNSFSTAVVHDIVYNKDPICFSDIPKASVKAVHAPTSLSQDTLTKQRFVIPDMSPLKTPFPSANMPQEAPLPTIDTFKKPYPLPGDNYYHMLPQQPTTSTIVGPNTGYISTNYHIQPIGVAANAHLIHQNDQNEYNVTPVVTINTPTAPNSLIVLENKVLSQDEMIDLTALRLSKSKVDAPQRFARPHKPIPEVVIKQEKPDDFPTISSAENIQVTPTANRNTNEEKGPINQNHTKGLVLISSNQNRKFIVNASKLKLPPEKIADLAKKIAERTASQTLKTERRNMGPIEGPGMPPNNTMPLEVDKKNLNNPQLVKPIVLAQGLRKSSEYSLKADAGETTDVTKTGAQKSAAPQEPSEKIHRKSPQIIINSQHSKILGQKFFLIVKKDPKISTKATPNAKPANVPEVSPMTTSDDPQMSPPQGDLNKVNQTQLAINKPAEGSFSFQYSPIKNRKSAVEIIDEPEGEENSFSAVDFIASLASSNPITEETQLELSPEELNLNASCAMNFSPLRIPFSPRKIKVPTPHQHRQVTTSPALNSELYKENSVEIGNIVTLREDNNVVNIDPEKVSISTEVVDTIVIESSRGRDHVLRKSVESNNMPLVASSKMKPIKAVNVLDSNKLKLQKTKDVEENKVELEAEVRLEAAQTIDTSNITSDEIMSKKAKSDVDSEAGADITIKSTDVPDNITCSEKETNEVYETASECPDGKTTSSQNLSKNYSHDNIIDKMSNKSSLEQEQVGSVETLATHKPFSDEADEATLSDLSTKSATEYVDRCIPKTKITENIKESPSSLVLQNTPPYVQEKLVEVLNEKVDDVLIMAPSNESAIKASNDQMSENVPETVIPTEPQPTAIDTDEAVILIDNTGSLKSILKTNSPGEATDKNIKETVQKMPEFPDTVQISEAESNEDTDKTKVPELNSSTLVSSKRISRFKKGKINLVQRNKPSATISKSSPTTHTLSSNDTATSLASIDNEAVEIRSTSPAKSSTPALQTTVQTDEAAETTIDPQFSNNIIVEQPISVVRTDSEEKNPETQSDLDNKETECDIDESIQSQILTDDLDQGSKVELKIAESNELNEFKRTLISNSKPTESEPSIIAVECLPIKDIENSCESTKHLENTVIVTSEAIPPADQTVNAPKLHAPHKVESMDTIMVISTEMSQKNISQLINPTKISKRKSNIKKLEDVAEKSPSPTPKDMKRVTVSLVDIVKNPPSEITATPPQIPFKRKLEETSPNTDEIKGIKHLLEKIKKPESNVKEHECNEEPKQIDSELDSQTMALDNSDDKDGKIITTKESHDVKTHDQPHTMAVAAEATNEQKDENYLDNKEVDTEVKMTEEESTNQTHEECKTLKCTKDLAIEGKTSEANARNRGCKSDGDFKSADELDTPKSETEKLTSKVDSISDNSKQSFTPSPIRSRRFTRLGLGSAVDGTTNKSPNIASRCSTRHTKTEAKDAKSSKKQSKSLNELNSKEEIITSKDKDNVITSRNSQRLSDTEEHCRETLFDKVKNYIKTPNTSDDVRIRSTRLHTHPCGAERLRQCATEKSTLSSNSIDAADSCQDNTQDPKTSAILNQRKRLRKTLEDIKKSHKLVTDSDDDRDFDIDSTNGCEAPTDFLGFEDNFLGSVKNQKPDRISNDEKSPTNTAKSKGGTLKNWLTTGKAISPTSSKDGEPKRLRHAKTSPAIRGIPLKKRCYASTKLQEETDITDDTSPADDEDGEDCTKVKRSKRYLKTVINSNKDLINTKRLKLIDGEDNAKHTFVEPKPVEPKTKVSETDSDTPACSRRRLKRPRRRLISDDLDENESSKISLRNSKQPEKDDSKEQAFSLNEKVNLCSEKTETIISEASALNLKNNLVKSVKVKSLVRDPAQKEVMEIEDTTISNEDEHIPITKLRGAVKSRHKRKLKLEGSKEEVCKKEEKLLEELKPKPKRAYRRKIKIEDSDKDEKRTDVKEDTEKIGTKRAGRKKNNVEPTINPRSHLEQNDVSNEHKQDEKLNTSQSDEPQTPTSEKAKRGKYQRRVTPENEFNPRLLLITKREQLQTDEVLIETNPGVGPIQCGLCMKRTTQEKWEIHLAEHYGVGWKIGDDELNIQYRPSVLNIIMAYLKDTEIKGLQCRMCQKLYRSALGLVMHIEVCGAKKQRVDCEYCHKDYTIFSLPVHLRFCSEKSKQFKQENETLEIQGEVFGATGRAKRYSTIKAESKLKQLGAELGQSIEESQDFNPKDLIKYNPPLGDDVRQKWSSDVVKFGKGFCPKKSCSYASDKIDHLEDHIKKCKFLMKVGYYCTFCKRRCFNTEKEALAHINTLHRNGKDFSGSDSDCNIKTEDEQTSNDDDDLSEGVDEDETDENELQSSSKSYSTSPRKNVRKSKKRTPAKSNSSPATILRKRVFPRRSRDSINKFVLQKWKSFLKANYSSKPLYNNYKCQYSVLKTQQYIKYLPNQEISMKFSMAKDTTIPSILGEPESNIEWKQLERFKVINHNTDIFLFMGAPIICCSWVPLPANVEEQFLLVAYRKDMFKFTKFLNPKHVKTSLILFKVTQSKVNDVKQQHIEVHYGIAIEDGPIYNVSFLPSGGYSLKNNRLGLVAVASVENAVKVYALPIELTKTCGEESDNIPLIKITPSFVLNFDLMTPDTSTGGQILLSPQCLQLSWSEFSGHNHIFASFSNGFIGIWDVTNDPQENLNRFEVESVINFTPMNYFYVGEKGIKHFALHYDSNGPRWLAVACFYRRFMIYDIRNFMQPIPLKEDLARNVVRSMDWCPLWEPVLIGYCDSIPNNGRCIQCINPVNVMYQQQKLDHMNSAVTALHYSPMTNTCVASVDNGDVMFLDCRELHYEQPLSRKFGERRVLSCMDIKRLDEKPIERLVSAKDNKKDNQELEIEWNMYEYDYKEKYGLVFKQFTKLNDSSKSKFFNEKRRAPLNIAPFTRINALRCNLNKTAKRLVAVGYENGFIRIFYFDKDPKC